MEHREKHNPRRVSWKEKVEDAGAVSTHLLPLEAVPDLLHPVALEMSDHSVRGDVLGLAPRLVLRVALFVFVNHAVEEEPRFADPRLEGWSAARLLGWLPGWYRERLDGSWLSDLDRPSRCGATARQCVFVGNAGRGPTMLIDLEVDTKLADSPTRRLVARTHLVLVVQQRPQLDFTIAASAGDADLVADRAVVRPLDDPVDLRRGVGDLVLLHIWYQRNSFRSLSTTLHTRNTLHIRNTLHTRNTWRTRHRCRSCMGRLHSTPLHSPRPCPGLPCLSARRYPC
jgi:hypothetical protein